MYANDLPLVHDAAEIVHDWIGNVWIAWIVLGCFEMLMDCAHGLGNLVRKLDHACPAGNY